MLLKTKRPVRRFMMIACAVAIGGWLNNLRTDSDTAKSETSRVVVYPGWVACSPAGAGFTVMMPARPQLQRLGKIESGGDGISLRFKIHSSHAEATSFSVMYADYPAAATAQYSPDELLSDIQADFNRSDNPPDFTAPIEIAGAPGVELIERHDGAIWHYRICIVQNRCYILLAATKGTIEPQDYLEWFFDSFKIAG